MKLRWKIKPYFLVELIKSDILLLPVESIVNPANSYLKHGGG
jgi:O-acetyl-ADP-ribose deacetylase (regulator of RNase III)